MSVRAYRDIHRRKSRQIMVGKVPVGGDAPITVQTMTNTITGDARATIEQIRRIEEAGCDIVRVSCPDDANRFHGRIHVNRSMSVAAARNARRNARWCRNRRPGRTRKP